MEVSKPTFDELDKILNSLIELPKRISRYDELLKNELLIHIKNRKTNLINTINDFLISNPEKDFDYFKKIIRQRFSFVELDWLEGLIIDSFEKKKELDKFTNMFINDGKDFFDYLSENFNSVRGASTKYTIIFHFLKSEKLINCNNKDYLTNVKEYCNLKIKFNRLDFDVPYNDKYKKNEQELTQLYGEFKKLKIIE